MAVQHHQLTIGPFPVGTLNHSATGMVKPVAKTVKSVNLLRITRETLRRCDLKAVWLASLFGCSEQLISAQLSEHADEKHLSMRKMERITIGLFWDTFLQLLAEDLGYAVISIEERQALDGVRLAFNHYERAVQR